MVYINIVCIAVSAFLAGMLNDVPMRVLNGAAAVLNIVVVSARIASLTT